MATRTKREYVVYVRMVGERRGWSYVTRAKSAGQAVERILYVMGWLPAQYADTFVTAVVELPF